MKKGGIAKATLGLTVGLLLGFGILALKSYIAEQVVGLLAEEIAKSCNCKFETDSVAISFLPLRAEARGARIVSEGKPALAFEYIRADIGLSEITNRIVLLSEITLKSGHANGIGPDSPTFKFIDHLTEPLPIEKDYPGRWKARLLTLRLINSSITEPFTSSSLLAEGVEMEVSRDELDNFRLIPTIKKLRVIRNASASLPEKNIVTLGHLKTFVYIANGTISYKNLQMGIQQALVNGDAISHSEQDNKLEGKFKFSADSKSYDFPDWVRLGLIGDGYFSGTLGRPSLKGEFINGPASPISFGLNSSIPIIDFDQSKGNFEADIKRKDYSVKVPQFTASGPGNSIRTTEPLIVDNDDLSGKFKLEADTVVFEDGVFHNVQGTISLGAKIYQPRIEFTGHSRSVTTHGFLFHDLELNFKQELERIAISASHKSDTWGSLNAQGNINIARDNGTFEDFKFSTQHFAIFQGENIASKETVLQSLRFSGDGSLGGKVGLETTTGNANTEIFLSSGQGVVPIPASVSLKAGLLRIEASDPNTEVNGLLEFNLLKDLTGTVNLSTKDLQLQKYFPSLECLRAAGNLQYTFNLASPWTGNGQMKLNSFEIGCAPYTINTDKPINLISKNGNIAFPPVTLRGQQSSVLLQGEISAIKGFALNAQGRLELSALLSLIPSLDDIRGALSASLDIRGPLNAPFLVGFAKIHEGEFSAEAMNLSASNLEGEVVLDSATIKVRNLKGALNGGSLEISGDIYPLQLEKSSLNIKSKGVNYEPADNTVVQIATDLRLTQLTSGRAGIEGNIIVEGGEFAKTIDLTTLMRNIATAIVASSVKHPTFNKLPQLDLNVAVSAQRNLFIYTNWAGAELKGSLLVNGSLANPTIDGKVETITGWFGIKDRRFEITSGVLQFRPDLPAPQLEIIGEAYVPSHTGETILVIAEARGSIGSPSLSLSSDSGLSQRDILQLLASGLGSIGQTKINTFSNNLDLENPALLEDLSLLSLPSFLSRLTRIDSLSFQPSYNLQTGLIEPFIIAEKRITNGMSLVGESSLGGTVTESRLKLLYDLSPTLKVSGFVESVSTHQNSAFGGDLTYTILAKQKQSLELTIIGNKEFDRQRLVKAIRINENSKIPISGLQQVKDSVVAYYHSQGFFSAEADVSCNGAQEYCDTLKIVINEGSPSFVSEVVMEGDSIEGALNSLPRIARGAMPIASAALLEKERLELTQRLRNEGYIASRVASEFRESAIGNKSLVFQVRLGQPVSFTFHGNAKFSARQFLDTINLFSRRLPFGTNTINILIQNIERLYRESGYLYATISAEKLSDLTTNRINYSITIDEGSIVSVQDVVFVGNLPFEPSALRAGIAVQSPVIAEGIFSPHFVVAEDLDASIDYIREFLIEQGYPDSSVSYEIQTNSEEQVSIFYHIEQGEAVNAATFSLQGFPIEVVAPPKPEAPYSIPKANRYIDSVVSTLRDHGYLNSTLWTDLDVTQHLLTIHVEPGDRVHFGDVKVEGILNVDHLAVKQRLIFKDGEGWDINKINESKRQLLRLGLFSRIEILPTDGELNALTEDVVVKLTEKPLRTLEVGGGVNSEYGLHLYGEGVDRKTFSDGRLLSLRIDTYYDSAKAQISQGIAGLRYSDPSFLESEYNLGEDLRFQKIDLSTQEFNLERSSLASYLYRSWQDGFSLSFGHTLVGEDLSDVSNGAILSDLDTGHLLLSFLSASASYDGRDNPLSPHRGFYLALDANTSSNTIGSEANFFGLGSRASWLLPLESVMPRFSLALALRGASSWAYAGTTQVPIAHRYYLGGRNTVRGFRENSLGPKAADGSIIGGDIMFATNTELRYLFEESLSAHIFFDAGSVFLRSEPFSFDQMRYSAGVGFRYQSPIGPIGFDIGHPLDEQDGEPSVRVHFSIGTNF